MVKYSLISFLLLAAGVNADERDPRIINGEDVVAGTYPWFARPVTSDMEWDGCGGSLISAEYILTAGAFTRMVSFSFAISTMSSSV